MAGSVKDFYTRALANEGRQVPLLGPDRKPSQHWLRILHTDSDAYRKAVAGTLQKVADLAQERDTAKRETEIKSLQYDAMAALVVAWSFDEPCTHEAVVEMLREAPYIADYIDRKAADASLFFGSGSGSSSTTPSPAPDSSDDRKTDGPSGNT